MRDNRYESRRFYFMRSSQCTKRKMWVYSCNIRPCKSKKGPLDKWKIRHKLGRDWHHLINIFWSTVSECCFRALTCKILHVCTSLHSLRVMYIKRLPDISDWHGNCSHNFPQTLEIFLDINWLRHVIYTYCSDVNFSYSLKNEIQWNSMNHLPIPSENILISSDLLYLSISL